MSEPTAPRPVPGPPRPGPSRPGPAPTATAVPAVAVPVVAADPGGERGPRPAAPATPAAGSRLAGLDALPVAEHVAVFEAEHERLQRELGTIDPR